MADDKGGESDVEGDGIERRLRSVSARRCFSWGLYGARLRNAVDLSTFAPIYICNLQKNDRKRI